MIRVLLFALAMPRLEDGAETYEHLEGLLGGTRPLLDVLAPSPAPSSEYPEVSPAPRRWTEWMEVWSARNSVTFETWTGPVVGFLGLEPWEPDGEAQSPGAATTRLAHASPEPSVQVEWDNLMAECMQNPDPYVEAYYNFAYLGGALTTGDALALMPRVLERCAVHEATCGFSLVVCNWLRDETIPFLPAQRKNEQPVVHVYYYQSCDCLLLLLFVVLSALACASCKPRPLVVEAEPVKV